MELDEDYFTDLNDDCIFKILEWLPLNDLCEISETCKKLKRLSGNHFYRKYKELVSKYITITDQSGRIGFWEDDKYLQHFSQQIENVCVSACRTDERLSQFMRARCAGKLTKVVFQICDWIKTGKFANDIQNILKDVEVGVFHVFTETEVAEILEYCPQFKYLNVFSYSTGLPARKHYPMLESVGFHFDWCDVDFDQLSTFFHQNSQIKRLKCYGPANADAAKRLLTAVAEKSGIEELFINIFQWNFDLQLCLNELKALDDRHQFKRLEIAFSNNRVQNVAGSLSSMKKLVGLHVSPIQNLDAFNGIQSFANLKVLVIRYDYHELIPHYMNLTKCVTNGLAQNLVNLEELYLLRHKSEYIDHESLLSFARYSKNLYKICLSGRILNEGEMTKLTTERNKLNGACKLAIYLYDRYDSDHEYGLISDLYDKNIAALRRIH